MATRSPWQAALLLVFGASRTAEAASYVKHPWEKDITPSEPLGCFNYGYKFQPQMSNVTGMPFLLGSPNQCQARCRATPGCVNFGYWKKSQECWLGGADASLIVAPTLGAVSGPARCDQESAACTAIPGPEFPGPNAAASRAAWVTRDQPTNLQCWPRSIGGFPQRCVNRTATVLEDTLTGWPGKCDGMRQIQLNPGETCQTRCMMSPLCGVWKVENSTSVPGTTACWHAMFGKNCWQSGGVAPMRAQRIMHGSFRVLMNTMGMQIMNLSRAFDATPFPKWQDGARKCRLTCLSYVLCQYWQYSDVWGCWVEDVMQKRVAYPLVDDGVGMLTASTGSSSVKAGEYIQHICAPGPYVPMPTDPPGNMWVATPAPKGALRHSGVLISGNSVVPQGQKKHESVFAGQVNPAAAAPGSTITVRAPGGTLHNRVAAVNGGTQALHEEPGGWPLWATILMCLVVALCLGVVGAAVWMSVADADKHGTRSVLGVGGAASHGPPGNQRSSFYSGGGSFDGSESGTPLVHNNSFTNAFSPFHMQNFHAPQTANTFPQPPHPYGKGGGKGHGAMSMNMHHGWG